MAKKPKRYDSFKSCLIRTANDEYLQKFTNDWTFTEIRSWMLDTYCIEESSIVELEMSSVTIYKNEKPD